MNTRSTLSFIAIFLFTIKIPLFSQPDTSDYRRADDLVKLTTGKVFYGNVRPTWINSSGRFLYESTTPEGTDYFIVDANNGTKRVAFDQKKFVTAFESATGKKAIPGKLPITNLVFSERLRSFSFNYDNYSWICSFSSPRNFRNPRNSANQPAQGPPPSTSDYRILKGDKLPERTRGDSWDWGFRDELANGPVDSPDKKWSAFIRNYNVYVRSGDDRKEYQLSFDGGTGEYYSSYMIWSPDSKKLVSNRVRPAEKHMINYVESSPEDQLQPKHYVYEYQKPGDAVPQMYPQLFDIETKKHIKVDAVIPDQYSIEEAKWSSNSSYFTFEYNKRGHQVYQVIMADALTGKTKIVINETSPTFIDYSGKQYRYDIERTKEMIWTSERDGWNHLWIYDSESSKVKNQITKGEWVVRGVNWVDTLKRQIIFQASGKEPGDPYFINCYRINFDGTGLVRLTSGDGNHEVSFSPDKRFFVDSWSRVDVPPVSVLRDAADGKIIMEIEKADISKLLNTGIKFPEPFVAKGRDGVTDIWGVIVRPTNFDPSKKYPVIENIYAGPHSSFVPKSFRGAASGMHQLAELGFIVVQIDGMGTSNRSKAFHDVCFKNLKDAGFPDRILWIKAAAEKYPYMDITKVGIYGTSAGGQNAAGAVLFHPEFYKAAVAACGCHDNRMDKMWWNEQWMGWPVGAEYAESSNIENAWRLKGKLLLINGEMDNNVDPSSTTQFVNALIKANKDFDYLLIPGAKHTSGGVYGERKRRDFFVKNLLGAEPPQWNQTGR
jgi:dipeptidyl aminopeptidase/acylaminoacyl peptidase